MARNSTCNWETNIISYSWLLWILFLSSINAINIKLSWEIRSAIYYPRVLNRFIWGLSHGFLKVAFRLWFMQVQDLLCQVLDMLHTYIDNLNLIYSNPFHCTSNFISELLNTKLDKAIIFFFWQRNMQFNKEAISSFHKQGPPI